MPNWTNNVVDLMHDDPAMIERAREAFNKGALLQEFIPCPEELRETVAQFGANDQEKENLKKFGYASWYDWNIANWGTKWDIGADGQPAQDIGTDYGPGLILSFDSAWSPPLEAYAALMKQGFRIRAYYFEPGMCFVGKWDNGCDEYYEYSGTNSATVRELIGEELDDMFNISEDMAQWEDENEIAEE